MHAHARTCLRLLQPCMCLMSAHSAPVLACAETDQHIVTNILLDVSSIKDVRFSISKDFWRGYPFHDELEDRVFGKFERWINAASLKPKILWDDGEADTARTAPMCVGFLPSSPYPSCPRKRLKLPLSTSPFALVSSSIDASCAAESPQRGN